ncbi:tyrosyl-tRNA synthetase [Roseimicrobium gellanilyticum]|uniref:Tyrosine--tRNA ligase n=1 Tax=Roseimicrobium gellanilyticum TaxID=748857 RepID=A0A366HJ09_9BACT|nr:tyrosine--tRNA ligase [Roseimicrobium gellanilyticum]RBP42355.1 tyrosyl-tRNA synthetase [Roseimicrobium gellanilyticum]
MNILDDLKFRGLIADYTGVPESRTDILPLPERLAAKPITLYCGFDPTADSLHVGHIVPLLALRRFQKAGHHPIAVAGGATGSIGDPSGKSAERSLLTKEQIQANVDAVRPQLAKLLDFDTKVNPARLMDNADWFGPITYLDFLRDVGKHFTVNQMVAKESVRARMEDRDVGISYTEFSYMLLQSYDYYHLAKEFNCELQIGGSDQWGNITTGIDLVRKKLGQHAYGMTLPLITKSDGTKFGKTEGGAIWLDPKRTSVYKFYQFWINTDDRDVVKYLKFFTFLPHGEITDLEKSHVDNPGARRAHQALAQSITTLIHGDVACNDAIRASEILFGGTLDGISESTLDILSEEVPTAQVTTEQLGGEGLSLVDALVTAGLSQSKGQARKDIEGGGVYLNGERAASATQKVTTDSALYGRYLLLRKGKRNYALLTL